MGFERAPDDVPPGCPENRAERLFAELYPGLRRFAAVVSPIEMDPDDLVQEALARVLEAHTLADIADPGAYLRTTIFRLAANERRALGRVRRALGRRRYFDEGEYARYPSDLADLNFLSSEDRAVLYLNLVEGEPLTEIAMLLGRSEASTRVRKHRALQRLRRKILEEGTEHEGRG